MEGEAGLVARRAMAGKQRGKEKEKIDRKRSGHSY
jgi:hypothetical protein